MAKKTLLELVQDILNDLDSDFANSIDDSVEAGQVANIVKTCYEEIISNRNWPHSQKLLQLLPSNDLAKPNYMRLPDDVKETLQVKYDVKKKGETKLQYKDIKYLYQDEFLSHLDKRDSDKDNILLVTDFSGVQLAVQTDKQPEYWTSFDDEYIVFDSYDLEVDDTLKKAKSQIMCYTEPRWEHKDDFVPDLPSEAFALLLEESKSTAFLVLKQMANQKAEQKAGRQQRWLSRKAWKANGDIRFPDYGRKSKK